MMTWDELVQQWWVQATSGLAGGLALMGVAAIFSKTVRDKFWKPIGHAIVWPFVTIQFTTAKRQEALSAELKEARESLQRNAEFYAELCDALGIVLLSGDQQLIDRVCQLREDSENNARRYKELCDLLDAPALLRDSSGAKERIIQLREAKDTAWKQAREQIALAVSQAQQQIEATQSLAQHQLEEQARRGVKEAEAARARGQEEGQAQAWEAVAAERATPRLRPAWRVMDIGNGYFDLRNTQSGIDLTDIRDVSIQAPMRDFAFDGSNQWPGPFPGVVGFEGSRTGSFAVNFVVRWQDHLGDHQTGEAVLEARPRRATVL